MGLQAVPLRSPYGVFVKLLHPFAPHIAEEMWSILGVFCTKAALEKLAMDNDPIEPFLLVWRQADQNRTREPLVHLA